MEFTISKYWCQALHQEPLLGREEKLLLSCKRTQIQGSKCPRPMTSTQVCLSPSSSKYFRYIFGCVQGYSKFVKMPLWKTNLSGSYKRVKKAHFGGFKSDAQFLKMGGRRVAPKFHMLSSIK